VNNLSFHHHTLLVVVVVVVIVVVVVVVVVFNFRFNYFLQVVSNRRYNATLSSSGLQIELFLRRGFGIVNFRRLWTTRN